MLPRLSQSGFTLVELLVAIGITVLIGIMASQMIISSFRDNAIIWEQLKTQSEGRTVLNRVVNTVRRAEQSSVGGYNIAAASANDVTFYANIDEDNFREQVRFYLSGTTLYQSTVKPSGSPLTYVTSTATVVALAENIMNSSYGTPVFEYYDESYSGVESPMVEPIDIPSIRMIRVQIELEKDPTEIPVPLRVESMVQVRNLKTN